MSLFIPCSITKHLIFGYISCMLILVELKQLILQGGKMKKYIILYFLLFCGIAGSVQASSILWDISHGVYLEYQPSEDFSDIAAMMAGLGYTLDVTSTGIMQMRSCRSSVRSSSNKLTPRAR